MARRPKRYFYLLLGVILVAAVAWGIYRLTNSKAHPNTGSPNTSSTGSTSNTTNRDIRLIATGDWIAHDSINSAALQSNGSYNYLPLVSDFIPIFEHADISFCNDPILNGGESLGVSGYPKFNSPTEFVTDMGKLGCNLINLASNHSFDFTQANINNSVSAWQNTPNVLAFAGENQNTAQYNTVHYFTLHGVKFAFLAYTTYLNSDAPAQNDYGVNVFSTGFASAQIATARQNGAQFIIASMRWGTEYSTAVTSEQVQDAQWLADQGVNLVLGHGTHVLQPVTWLSGPNGSKTLVWYGLGDFLQSQEPSDTVFNGIAALDINPKTLAIEHLGFIPIYMHYSWTPAEQAADDIAARNNLHLYLLEDANQSLIDAQQLSTTISEQEQRLSSSLTADGINIPLINSKQYLAQY